MPEFSNTTVQTVAVGGNVLFTETPVPCKKGCVNHRTGAGIVTLKGNRNSGCGCCQSECNRYKVTYGANIAVPTGGTAQAISLAIAIDGEGLPATERVITPTVVNSYGNVSATTIISVPCSCCYVVSVKNTSSIPILVDNANIVITKEG